MLNRQLFYQKICALFFLLFIPSLMAAVPSASWTSLYLANQSEFAMAFDPKSGQTILFGGRSSDFSSNTTWALSFNIATQTYAWNNITPAITTSENNPSARTGACMTFDATNEKIILFGGLTQDNYLNDLWSLSFSR